MNEQFGHLLLMNIYIVSNFLLSQEGCVTILMHGSWCSSCTILLVVCLGMELRVFHVCYLLQAMCNLSEAPAYAAMLAAFFIDRIMAVLYAGLCTLTWQKMRQPLLLFFSKTGFLCVIALAILELTLYTRLALNSQISTCLSSRVLGLKTCTTTAQLTPSTFIKKANPIYLRAGLQWLCHWKTSPQAE